MTNGNIYLILKDKILKSHIFSGDLYPEKRGDRVLKLLRLVHNEKDFKTVIKEINIEDSYDIEEEKEYSILKQDISKAINFNINYFKRFFADWIFFKNLSNKDILFIGRPCKKEYILKPNKVVRFYFGHTSKEYYEEDFPNILTKTLDEIDIIKNNCI